MVTAQDKGREEGHAEGRAEGAQEKALEIARSLKAMGLSDEEITKATGLDHKALAKI